MSKPTISSKNHRFAPRIIAHVGWLHFRFPLSLRLVEEVLLERGIMSNIDLIRGPTTGRRILTYHCENENG